VEAEALAMLNVPLEYQLSNFHVLKKEYVKYKSNMVGSEMRFTGEFERLLSSVPNHKSLAAPVMRWTEDFTMKVRHSTSYI
jgi:hypothetical protein